MISTVSIRNLHLDAIGELLDDGESDVEYLIVAHQDSTLELCLASAFAGTKAAMYQVPQQSWNLEDEDLSEAIQWAVEIGKVKNVLLVGSSAANVAGVQQDQAEAELSPDSQRPTLTERVRTAVLARQSAGDHFLAQFRTLSAVPEIAQSVSAGQLRVDGLFYRAESGVFTYYDEKTDSFAAIS